MSELLVIFACLNHTGCAETSSQYYVQHPDFKAMVERQEAKIRDVIAPTAVQYWGPFIMAAAGQEATARISSRFYLTGGLNKQTLLFKQEF